MPASASSHRVMFTGREKLSRQAWARSRPVAMPSRAASACNSMAIRPDSTTTDSRR